MVANNKVVPEASREIIEFANAAARAYQLDKRRFGIVQPMKTYFAAVLRRAGLKVTEERFRQMGRVLGRRGGKKAARRRRAGEGPEPVVRQEPIFHQSLLPFRRPRLAD